MGVVVGVWVLPTVLGVLVAVGVVVGVGVGVATRPVPIRSAFLAGLPIGIRLIEVLD